MAHLYQGLTMDDEDSAANIILCNVSSAPSVPWHSVHSSVTASVGGLCACKHWWLHIYEQGLKTTVIPTILSRSAIYSSMQLPVTVKYFN